MLEEIIGVLISLFSLVLNEPPRVSFRGTSHTQEEWTDNDNWLPYINEEYENNGTREESSSLNLLSGVLANEDLQKSYLMSLRKAIRITISMTLAMFPHTVFTVMFLYADLNTTDLCVEWQHHNNTVPLSVERIRVIGKSVEAVINNLWFPLTAVVLFGWKVFKLRFFSTFYIAFIVGEATVIYVLFLLAYGVYDTHMYYLYPSNIMFFTGIICCSVVILRNIRASGVSVSYSNAHIMALISMEFVLCSLLSFIYRYAIVPFFISIEEGEYKFMVAAMAPAITIIPAVICKHIALRRSSELVHPGRSFVLAYVIRGGAIYLYRIMQTDFKNIWLFIGLSLFSGVMNFLKKATLRVRMALWKYIISLLRRTACCARLKELPCNTPHYRRLKADLEIQDVLFEYSTLVISQAYFVLYHIESFELSMPSFFLVSLKRIAIGIGIDFFFNCLSNFVQIHYYNIPIARVWKKHWKRHVLANLIIVIMMVSYFTEALLSCFQTREPGANDRLYTKRNCTFFWLDLS